jgi:hypothetical protein
MNNNTTLIVTIAVIAIVVGVRIWRMSREQRFGIVTMWIVPAIFAALALSVMIFDRFTNAQDIALAMVALAAGGAIGWYQGTHTTVRIDQAARAMFVKISPFGAAIFLSVLLLRMGIRASYGAPMPGAPGGAGTLSTISILMLLLAVGVVAGLRLYLARVYSSTPLPKA